MVLKRLVFLSALAAAPAPAQPLAPDASHRPQARDPDLLIAQGTANAAFDRWIEGFRARALARGIEPALFDAAFAGIRYNADVIARDRNQAEFSKALWEYLDTAVSDIRVSNGRDAFARHAELLARIEADHGVEAEIVTAIWGLESAYGAVRGDTHVVEAMATLAHDGRRRDFFEGQLMAALRILQAGDVTPRDMTGSWAGAMGHTQFIPTSYLDYAVDGDGDGRRDIWGDDPADALASTAHYLARHGWQAGQPWGIEVTLPEGFDYTLANRRITRAPSDWAEIGILGLDGQPVPDHGRAAILLPAGHRGAAFMIFDNFAVLEHYNTADSYVIAVGHLADRIAGAGPFAADWPREDRALTFVERQELQRLLRDAGFDPQGVDGRIGPLTIDAIRAYQLDRGLVPDGYASVRLLERLR
ncbi:MAG: membrane-bound lytic murein transglycosylase B [Rhodobacteraceae bacterium HLUCCA08]|nr:MAG: membrane-bound lytic murein transglycosylase B [Rhodobacteraceae bacterium HLUCCA08]